MSAVDPPRATVEIVQLDLVTLQALAAGDVDAANRSSPVALPPSAAVPVWLRRAVQVAEHPGDAAWVTGVVVDTASGRAVGQAGFHGPPDDAGMVEIGYGIDPEFRRQGFARAALVFLLARAAREPSVRTVRVTISPENAASRGLALQHGFVENGEQWDDEDGLEIIYEVPARP